DPCQNGGHWTGTGCLCPPNLVGDHCQFGASTINITAELGPSVTMSARVTNRNFSEDMRDTSSAAYRSFMLEFSQMMDRIYRNVTGYKGIRVLTLTKGSVVVNYKVLLHPPAGDTPTTGLDHQARELLEVANAAAQPQNCSHLEGRCQATHCRSGLGSPDWCLPSPDICRKYTPANFSRYYYLYRTQNSFLCITNCTLNVPGSIDCSGG
ncbi:MUC3B protein, partial [Steatornis caripensis]|nr:MUC3B protein [Steatornis caripensis]